MMNSLVMMTVRYAYLLAAASCTDLSTRVDRELDRRSPTLLLVSSSSTFPLYLFTYHNPPLIPSFQTSKKRRKDEKSKRWRKCFFFSFFLTFFCFCALRFLVMYLSVLDHSTLQPLSAYFFFFFFSSSTSISQSPSISNLLSHSFLPWLSFVKSYVSMAFGCSDEILSIYRHLRCLDHPPPYSLPRRPLVLLLIRGWKRSIEIVSFLTPLSLFSQAKERRRKRRAKCGRTVREGARVDLTSRNREPLWMGWGKAESHHKSAIVIEREQSMDEETSILERKRRWGDQTEVSWWVRRSWSEEWEGSRRRSSH